MKKADLLASVQAKAGFVAIVEDGINLDSPKTGTKQKRFLKVEANNADGTRSVYNITYWHDTATDDAWFFNDEPISLQKNALDVNQQAIDNLKKYCVTTFDKFFFIEDRTDSINKWAIVEVYTLVTDKYTKSLKMVYKQGANPITHADIV